MAERRLSRDVRALWLLSLLAFSIKLVLQALSVIPPLGRFAFGYRPVVIAYLHLVLLGFVTLFLLGFLLASHLMQLPTWRAKAGLIWFAAGVVVNEVVLTAQGVLGITGHSWASAVYFLLGAALWMSWERRASSIKGIGILRHRLED